MILFVSVRVFRVIPWPIAQQAYPDRPIRLVVPFPPGASNDVLARTLGEKMREALGQPIVVDNRGGAGTAIGTDIVAKSRKGGVK